MNLGNPSPAVGPKSLAQKIAAPDGVNQPCSVDKASLAPISIDIDATTFVEMSRPDYISIATLEERVCQVRMLLRRTQVELRNAMALLDGLERNDSEQTNGRMEQASAGGNLKNLSKSIVALLGNIGRPMTSVEIARSLYRHDIGISEDAFKRRVIVTISALYKRTREVVPAMEVGPGKPKEWTVAKKQEDRPKAVLQDGKENDG